MYTTRWIPVIASPQSSHDETKGHFESIPEPNPDVVLDAYSQENWTQLIKTYHSMNS